MDSQGADCGDRITNQAMLQYQFAMYSTGAVRCC